MSLLEVNKITPQSGTTLTLGDSGDTINFGSGVLPNFENLTVTGDLTVDTNSLYVDSANNYVGIGTASPQKMLHILNTATTGVTSTTPIHLRLEGNNSNYYDIGRDNQNTGFLSFYGNQSGANGYIFGGADGERMRIDSSGNVLVGGTTTPETSGLSIETTSASGGLNILSPNTGRGDIFFGDTNDLNVGQIRYAHTDNSMTFRTNTLDRMVIDSSGNVGIGTSSPTSNTLTLTGKYILQSNSQMKIGDNGIIGGGAADGNSRIDYFTSNSFLITQSNTERMRIDSSGRLLVGMSVASGSSNGVQVIQDGRIFSTVDGQLSAILNRKSSDGGIVEFRKDGATVGSIGASGGQIYVASTGGATYTFENGAFFGSDEDRDLGKSNRRFKDAYLSGNIYLGGTGSANALDDYEEGTFTVGNAGDSTGVIGDETGEYTKIGRMVYVRIVFRVTTNFSSYAISGLPYTVNVDNSISSWTPMIPLTESTNDEQIIPKFVAGSTLIYFDKNNTNNSRHYPNTTNNLYRLSSWYMTNA